MRIGILFNRARKFGRGFCEGVASWTLVRHDWRLEMLPPLCGSSGETPLPPGLDGLIAHVMDDAAAERFASLGIPVVADFYRVSSQWDGRNAAPPQFAQALPDHAAIGALAAEHFRERGFANYAFCGYDGILFSDERRDGFAAALAEHRFDCIRYKTPRRALDRFDERVILREDLTPRAPDARELVRWLVSLPKPCAVFCCHDLRAFQVLSAAQEAGLAVPGEIAILGVDNDALICSFTHPRLSTIDNAAFATGRAAAELLDGILAGRVRRDATVRVPPAGIVANASTDLFAYDPPWLGEALRFMRGHIADNLTASDVIARTGLSHTMVDRTFRRVLGTTVQSEIVRLRLEEAKRLLRTTALPVADVARMSGFSTPRYMTQVFKATLGVSPLAYRDNQMSPVR